MIISDLNYLESVEEEIFGGQGININSNFDLDKDVVSNVDIFETFDKAVFIDTSGIDGNAAEVLGSADAQGNDTFTSIIFGVQTEDDVSESFVNASAFTA